MQPGAPSLTARAAAAHRAWHQVLEGGEVFRDPLARTILGPLLEATDGYDPDSPERRSMRLFIAARSRFAEDALAAAVRRGVRQYVVLGAGLDTFACRNPFAEAGLTVFEVDHPATQAWKRGRLAETGLDVPASLVFAPVNFERETLAAGLAAAGFDAAAPTVFSWLGVIVYLTKAAIFDTLAYVAARPAGSEIVFDYGEPIEAYPPERQPAQVARAARVAALGEPWISRFQPEALAADLRRIGFDAVEDLGPRQIAERYFGRPGADGPGGHLLRAGRL